FYYLGPIDGHDLQDLKQGLLAAKSLNQPVLLHVETVKGKGYPYAEVSPDTYHGIGVFDVDSGEVCGSPATFSTVFGEELAAIAEQDDRICAMTAAMITGTGLSDFAERFPKRFFDVGIAESHAITFSSGLAKSGMIPVFAVYSTFLQRCFDQLINDTVLNNTHIVLAVDRAGVVPDDGETHQGLYDVGLLNGIPNVTVYSPSTFAELRLRLRQAIYDAEGIAVVRYPKGEEFPLPPWFSDEYKNFQYIGRESARQLAVTYGRIFGNLAAAADTCGVKTSLLKLNRIRPIDEECIRPALSYERILFFEEAFRDGGVGERFGCQLSEYGYTGSYEIVAATESIGICGVDSGLAQMGLDVQGMAARLLQ
ncbi:MAG: 1-deoxy-D-xylulose-5-phosphate synthase, partial [Oscillospiraceae bacterium]|nr:1-deoxy-D-xylulose-5-phosphate synthase [Oscillospiraceae bacterium]